MRRSIRYIASVCAFVMLAVLVSPSPAAAQEKTTDEEKRADRTVKLSEKNESGVKGTAALHPSEGEMAKHVVDVRLQGMEAGATYRLHLHGGTCARDGQVITPVASVEADTEGEAEATAELSVETLTPASSARAAEAEADPKRRHPALFLQARSADGAAVACGDVPMKQAAEKEA